MSQVAPTSGFSGFIEGAQNFFNLSWVQGVTGNLSNFAGLLGWREVPAAAREAIQNVATDPGEENLDSMLLATTSFVGKIVDNGLTTIQVITFLALELPGLGHFKMPLTLLAVFPTLSVIKMWLRHRISRRAHHALGVGKMKKVTPRAMMLAFDKEAAELWKKGRQANESGRDIRESLSDEEWLRLRTLMARSDQDYKFKTYSAILTLLSALVSYWSGNKNGWNNVATALTVGTVPLIALQFYCSWKQKRQDKKIKEEEEDLGEFPLEDLSATSEEDLETLHTGDDSVSSS